LGFNIVSVPAGFGQELSEYEMTVLRNQVARCWTLPADAVGVEIDRVRVKAELDPSGAVKGDPQVVSGPSESSLAQSAIRALKRCSPFSLPAEKFEAWKEITVTFDPNELF
jgi:hypothetical protein